MPLRLVKVQKFKRLDATSSNGLRSGAIALHLDSGRYFEFNDTGAFVWERLQTAQTLAQIAEPFAKRFRISLAAASRDVGAFLKELIKHNLVSKL